MREKVFDQSVRIPRHTESSHFCVASAYERSCERYNKCIAAHVRHIVANCESDCGTFVRLVTYAYDSQVIRSINALLLRLDLTGHLPGPTIIDNNFIMIKDVYHPTESHALTKVTNAPLNQFLTQPSNFETARATTSRNSIDSKRTMTRSYA